MPFKDDQERVLLLMLLEAANPCETTVSHDPDRVEMLENYRQRLMDELQVWA